MLPNRTLAPTTFIGGPEETLAAPDVYAIKDDNVINALPSLSSDTLNAQLIGEMTGGMAMAAKLPMLTNLSSATEWKTVSLSSLKETGSSVLSRVSAGALSGIPGLNGNGLSSLSSLLNASKLPASVMTLLNKAIPSSLGSVSSIGDVVNRIAPQKLKDAYQMGSLINEIIGGTSPMKITDRDSSARLISALSMGGISSGLPNAFSSVLSLAGGDKAITTNAAKTVLNFAAKSGGIASMKDIVKSVGVPALLSMGKSAISSLASNFQSASSDTWRGDYNDVKETFNGLDPDWVKKNKTFTDPVTGIPITEYSVVDITLAREGNTDFVKLMERGAVSGDDPDFKYFAMANAFPAVSPETELKKSFPLTVTKVATSTSSRISELPQASKNWFDEITIDGYTQKHLVALNQITID